MTSTNETISHSMTTDIFHSTDFEDKPTVTRATKSIHGDDEMSDTMATKQYEATWRRNPFFDKWENESIISLETQTDASRADDARAVLNTCKKIFNSRHAL